MTSKEIANIRLCSQRVSQDRLASPEKTVSWLVALQAQDLSMAMLAVGVRLEKAGYAAVEAALNKGSIIRTHLLRPTWHFAAARDVRWLLNLTAPNIKATMASRHRQLEITEGVLSKSNGVLEKALRDGKQLTREELLAGLEKAKIALNGNRASHLLFMAELEGILCSGAVKRGKPTYALFEDRIPASKLMSREEALAELARRYFASRSPASLQDFAWWSGMPVKDARSAWESVKGSFTRVPFGSREYLLAGPCPAAAGQGEAVHFLPAYDEFLLSYRDRSAPLSLVPESRVVSSNGIFRPVLVRGGRIAGIWKRRFEKGRLIVEVDSFRRHGASLKAEIEAGAARIGGFYGSEAQVIHAVS